MNNKLLPFVLVAQNNVAILERFGRFYKALAPGLQFKIPFIDVVAYHHTMKEQILEIESQTAITKDNVKIKIDGVLYFKITDAMKASYEISEPIEAISLLAQTSMRSEIGLLELDRTFTERDNLNINIKRALNDAGQKWGLEVLRYEIKDIKPPEQIKRSMELQAESERVKRSKILNSEGERQSKINVAEGYKQGRILEGQGKAQQISQEARSVVETLRNIGQSIKRENGTLSEAALRLRLSEQYIKALHEVYHEGNIITLPANIEGELSSNNPLSASTIATAFALYKQVLGNHGVALHSPEEFAQRSMSHESSSSQKQLEDHREVIERLLSKVNDTEKGGKKKKVRYLDDRALYDDSNTRN